MDPTETNTPKPIQTETVCCDLCHHPEFQPLFSGSDLLHNTPGNWTVVRCSHCNLVYTNPRPIRDEIYRVYPSEYQPHQQKHRHKINRRWKLRQWSFRHHWNYPPSPKSVIGNIISYPVFLLSKLAPRNYDLFPWTGEGKLLDYGCGGGKYLHRAGDLGWTVTGMDMSEQAAQSARHQGLDVRVGVDMDRAFPKHSFDVVTLFHVLEHVPSPTETLLQTHAVLKDKGRIVLAVPNIKSLPARWFGRCWFPLDLPRHLTHFSPDSIRDLLEKTGFKLIKITPQQHGQTITGSLRYLARTTGKKRYAFFARFEHVCYLIECLSIIIGQPARIVVHANKIPAPTS